jgi:hypothetical protein
VSRRAVEGPALRLPLTQPLKCVITLDRVGFLIIPGGVKPCPGTKHRFPHSLLSYDGHIFFSPP